MKYGIFKLNQNGTLHYVYDVHNFLLFFAVVVVEYFDMVDEIDFM